MYDKRYRNSSILFQQMFLFSFFLPFFINSFFLFFRWLLCRWFFFVFGVLCLSFIFSYRSLFSFGAFTFYIWSLLYSSFSIFRCNREKCSILGQLRLTITRDQKQNNNNLARERESKQSIWLNPTGIGKEKER